MQEMADLTSSGRVNAEYGALRTSLNSQFDDGEIVSPNKLSSRKKKVLKRADAVNLDEDEIDEDAEGPHFSFPGSYKSANREKAPARISSTHAASSNHND